jgi:superfamily II DNA or RNA helicase
MAAFIDSGIPFGYIDAQTPNEERTLQFRKMYHGEIAGVASVGCLIAGVDEDVRCIIDAAPTKSEISLVQRWGRGIRTHVGKAALIGLDHAGNNTGQGLGLFWEIFHDHLDTHKPNEKGVAYEGEKRPAKPRKCAACNVLIPAGSAACKNCGQPIKATGIEHEEGELVVYGTQPKAKKTEREYSMQEKQDWLSGLLWIARERGKSDGLASHAYRDKFGVWPNKLLKVARPPSLEVEAWDKHRRIAYAKSKAKETASATQAG